MSQRTAKLLKMLTRMVARLLMVLRPKAAERWRCWTIAGMAEAPWQRSVTQHLIAAGVGEEAAQVEMQTWVAWQAEIQQQERNRITNILLRAEVSQSPLARKLIDDDVELFAALQILKDDREVGKAVNEIFASVQGGEDYTHGTC